MHLPMLHHHLRLRHMHELFGFLCVVFIRYRLTPDLEAGPFHSRIKMLRSRMCLLCGTVTMSTTSDGHKCLALLLPRGAPKKSPPFHISGPPLHTHISGLPLPNTSGLPLPTLSAVFRSQTPAVFRSQHFQRSSAPNTISGLPLPASAVSRFQRQRSPDPYTIPAVPRSQHQRSSGPNISGPPLHVHQRSPVSRFACVCHVCGQRETGRGTERDGERDR